MELFELANFGEFIGGVAVLCTLFYLVIQVRQGNVDSRAASQCKGGAVWWRIWPVPEDVRQYVASYVAAHASDLVSQEEIFPFWVRSWNEIESN